MTWSDGDEIVLLWYSQINTLSWDNEAAEKEEPTKNYQTVRNFSFANDATFSEIPLNKDYILLGNLKLYPNDQLIVILEYIHT